MLQQQPEFANYLKLSGWVIEKINSKSKRNFVFIKKFPILPALIMKIYYPDAAIDFKQIEALRKKYRPLSTQIFPIKEGSFLKKNGFKKTRSLGHVTKTIQINLKPKLEEIFESFKKDCRYSIKKAQNQNLEIKTTNNIKNFQKAFEKTVGIKHFCPSLKNLRNLKKSFAEKSLFLIARDNSKIIAGTIILFSKNTGYYYLAFTNKKGREKLAQYELVWEAIKISKRKGLKAFDMQGIYDKRFPIKSWKGFTHFKKGFAGKEIEFPPVFKRGFLN